MSCPVCEKPRCLPETLDDAQLCLTHGFAFVRNDAGGIVIIETNRTSQPPPRPVPIQDRVKWKIKDTAKVKTAS